MAIIDMTEIKELLSKDPPRRPMRRVIVESPFAGTHWCWPVRKFQQWLNVRYARKCVRDSLRRGEAPVASHLLYTQPGILNDDIPSERRWGIDAGLEWRKNAQASVVYIDRGISSGMNYGIKAAAEAGLPVDYRSLSQPPVRPLVTA